MIISSIVVKRIGLLFPRAGNGKRNRQQGYGGNIFEKIEKRKLDKYIYTGVAIYQAFKQSFNPTNRQENDFTPNPNFLLIPNSMWSMKIEETFGNFCNSTNNPETLNWSCSDINTAWLDVKAKEFEKRYTFYLGM